MLGPKESWDRDTAHSIGLVLFGEGLVIKHLKNGLFVASTMEKALVVKGIYRDEELPSHMGIIIINHY